MSITYSEPFLISSQGSTRATAYIMANKSVTMDGLTHVVWLDAVSEIMGRTYDHASGTWGETIRIGQGADNHATPTLSVDRDQRLRIVYGPHAIGWTEGRFKYAVAQEANSIGAFVSPDNNRVANFGCAATYASMVHAPQGCDVIVYRGGDYPYATIFQREREKGGWTCPKAIMYQDIKPQYTNYGSTIICDPDGVIYVGNHFYNVGGDFNNDAALKFSPGAAVLKSADLGETWTDLRGEPVHTPAPYSEGIAVPPRGAEGDIRLSGMALDSDGRLWVLCCNLSMPNNLLLLSRWTGEEWISQELQGHLPDGRLVSGATLTIDTADRIHIALAGSLPDEDGRLWGHRSSEIFHMELSPEGEPLGCNQLSTPDTDMPNWLPSISKAGPFSPVERPVILYTHGVTGDGCSPPDETEVYCVFAEPGDGCGALHST